ncbi:MAG: PQQ-binding-like beta-propeller repeat protein [Dehalococcoidia bacterium]|uniref:outer membrane protein assembly factor BamB family protein n=1 Tax=Candidatus Amarobacter glycogenicus TaxID=3140699 RepID=UPI001DF06DAF|nr:PQQ-binding-like beta-propeller repeat protein [Dehalococcoidia bacterium]MBK7725449.1 PQQ-binding-like beta-propeller repeat protein [Dehalococcoidia bacterium]MBK8560975.1 PQQ-binding-like beta-propeller repeat protein [Dehalococcoidia bacterium]
MNFRRGAIITLALLLLPLVSSCVSVLNPTGWAPVAFDGETAYVITSKGKLSAITVNGDSGAARWTFPDKDRDEDDKLDTKAIYGAPVIEGDRIYLATFEAGVFALRKEDGRPIWPTAGSDAASIDGDIAGGVAVAGENVYFATTEGLLYALRKDDGAPATGWEKPLRLGDGIWATPVVHGDAIYVATMSGELHALSAIDGSERWSRPFKASGAIAELALISDELLFVPSINRHAYVVRMADGSVVADFRADDWLWTTPGVQGSKLFFGDFGGSVYGLDITSSGVEQLWEPASLKGERVRSGAAVVNGVIVVVDRKPVVTFIDANDGSILNTVPIEGAGTVRANLVVKDGAAYFSTTGGKLFRAEPASRRVVEVQLSGVKK